MGIESGRKFVIKIETGEVMEPGEVGHLIQESLLQSKIPLSTVLVVSVAAVDKWPLLNNCHEIKCPSF
jgi:hypothetical protein